MISTEILCVFDVTQNDVRQYLKHGYICTKRRYNINYKYTNAFWINNNMHFG